MNEISRPTSTSIPGSQSTTTAATSSSSTTTTTTTSTSTSTTNTPSQSMSTSPNSQEEEVIKVIDDGGAESTGTKVAAKTKVWKMESRTGRLNQRYSPSGDRLVAGVVPLTPDKQCVLLIQSVRRGGWVLPKGGWELDESTPAEAACREAWEEAGVICRVAKDLGTIGDMRTAAQVEASKRPKVVYHFFEVDVEREEGVWPEGHKRRREWVGYERAREALGERPELLEALERSSIVKQ